VVKLVNGIQTLTDFKSDRRISAGFNTGQPTGNAAIYLMVAQGVGRASRSWTITRIRCVPAGNPGLVRSSDLPRGASGLPFFFCVFVFCFVYTAIGYAAPRRQTRWACDRWKDSHSVAMN
jgi:hypothetical protein